VGEIADVTIRANASFTLTMTVDFSFKAEHLKRYPVRIEQTKDGVVLDVYTIELTAVKDLDDFFFGNPRSGEVHIATCPFWTRLDKRRLRTFELLADAQLRGYNGCRFCLPEADTD